MTQKLTLGSPRRGRAAVRIALAVLASAALSACAAVPKAGPLTASISKESRDEAAPFLLVPVSRLTLTDLSTVAPEDFRPLAGQQPPHADFQPGAPPAGGGGGEADGGE